MGDDVVKVMNPNAVQQYKDKVKRADGDYVRLFGDIDLELSKLADKRLSLEEKNNVVLGVEFLLVRMRSKLLAELSSIEQILNMGSSTTVLSTLCKSRNNTLYTYCTRLNELRDDFMCIQKTVYTTHFKLQSS